MRRTRIKICGITSREAAVAAVDAGADAIGLVFADSSPRRITIDLAAEIVQVLPPLVTAFGVFQLTGRMNEDLEHWSNIGRWCQLHGDEGEQQAKQVARRMRVVKGFRFDPAQVRRWDGCPFVEMLLVDGAKPGTGSGFRLGPLKKLMPAIRKPVMLAGGLTPENVGDAVRTIRPFAVDVSSGVESKPGVKDPERIVAFCQAVREADRGKSF